MEYLNECGIICEEKKTDANELRQIEFQQELYAL